MKPRMRPMQATRHFPSAQVFPKDKDLSKHNPLKNFYIVEKILDKKLFDGQWQYKVKWLNYPLSQCTWEPKENLSNVSLMLKYFDENFEKTQINKEIAVNNSKPLVSNTSSYSSERSASSSEGEENKNAKLRSNNKINNSINQKNNNKQDSSVNNNNNTNNNNITKNKPTKKRGRKPRQIKEKTRKRKNTLVLRYFNKIWRTIYDLQKKYSFSSDDDEAFENDSSARSLLEKSFESGVSSDEDSSFSYQKEQKKKQMNYGASSKKIKGEERGRGRPRKYPLNPARMELEEENSDEKSDSQEKNKGFSPKNNPKIREDKPLSRTVNMESKINKAEFTSKEKEKSLQLTKKSLELNQEKEVSLLPKPSKSIETMKENSIFSTDKNINQQEIIVLEKPLPEYGDISLGDKPKQIISATPGTSGDEVICLVEWLPRNDGTIPKRSKVSNQILKKFDVGLLVSFYESKLRFNQGKNKENEKKESSAPKLNKEIIDSNSNNFNSNKGITQNENSNNHEINSANNDHKQKNNEVLSHNNNNNDIINENTNKLNSENKNSPLVTPSLENPVESKAQDEIKPIPIMNIAEEDKKAKENTEKEVEKESKKKKDIASIIAELVEKSKNTN